jgi:hypothetical protein
VGHLGSPSKGFKLTPGTKYMQLKIKSQPNGEITYDMTTGPASQLSRPRKKREAKPEWRQPSVSTLNGEVITR